MTDPLVSIVMPVYNRSNLINASLESILHQTYPQWELWIVDDGSTDDTVDAIHRLTRDPRVHVIGAPHTGVAGARNTGLAHCTGTYIAFLDSDDRWSLDKLNTQVRFMLENHALISVGYFIDQTDNEDPHPQLRTCPKTITLKGLLIDNCILFQTLMAHQSLKQELVFPSLRHEDYAVALNLVMKDIPIHVIPQVLAYRRRHSASLTANKVQSAKWRYWIYRDIVKLPPFKASLYLIAYAWVSLTRPRGSA